MTEEESTLVTGPKLLITVAAMLASLMAVLDISIVNVAINDIRTSFGAQIDQITWISTGYMMANVIVIPLTGFFQRRFGLRNYFVFSILLFTIASLLCGLSWNLISLTLFRILQGLGGGAIIPTASTILMSRYPKSQQGMAQAFVGLGAITGPLFGPTLGGYLIEISTWHMIFLINIPVGILASVISYRYIEEKVFIPNKSSLDYVGAALLTAGLASLQYVLEEGNRYDWFYSVHIVILSAVSFVCLITLVFQQLESENAMINFKVFLNRNYLMCSFVNFFLGITLFSASFLFSLFCGEILNYAPIDIGLLFLKSCFIQVIMMPLVGRLVEKIDSRILIIFGITFVAYSILLNAQLTDQAGEYNLIAVLFIRSIGLAFVFVPLSVTALTNMAQHEVGNAVGLFNLTRELGGSIGLAVMSAHLTNGIQLYGKILARYLTNSNPILLEQQVLTKQMLAGRVHDLSKAANLLIHNRATVQATVMSFDNTFTILSQIFFGTLLLVCFLKSPLLRSKTGLTNLH